MALETTFDEVVASEFLALHLLLQAYLMRNSFL